MREADSCLTSQCLALCRTLVIQGQNIRVSLKISSNFNFSLDTKLTTLASLARKQKSPSTERQNTRRRKEFIAFKEAETPTGESRTKVVKELVETPELIQIVTTNVNITPYMIPCRRSSTSYKEDEALEKPATSKLSVKEQLVSCTHCHCKTRGNEIA